MKRFFFALFALLSVSGVWGQWSELEILSGDSVWASSVLTEKSGGKLIEYSPENLFDSDMSTAWVEGVKGYGRGESVTILTNKIVSEFSMINGFAKSERLFGRNGRVKDFSVSFICGLTAPGLVTENDYYLYFVRESMLKESLTADDSMDWQKFPLYDTEALQDEIMEKTISAFAHDYPDFFKMIINELGIHENDFQSLPNMLLIMEMYGFIGIKLTIEDVYTGSRYDDTCISELEFVF